MIKRYKKAAQPFPAGQPGIKISAVFLRFSYFIHFEQPPQNAP